MLILVLGTNIYLPWRLGNLFSLQNKIWLYILFAVGIISAFVSMSLKTRFSNILVSIYYNLATTWIGFFLFMCCLLVLLEITLLIHKFPPKQTGVVFVSLAALLTIYSMINAQFFRVSSEDIPLQKLENEIKIVQISDVHLGVSRSKNYLAKIVKKTNEINPDFVVITGDLADSKRALSQNMFTPLKDLKMPAFFVYGNHDVYVGLDEIIKRLNECNVKVLQNEVIDIMGITLVGINYMRADDSVYDPHQVTDETIIEILPTLDMHHDKPIVMLHHGPWGISYMNQYGVDLVLAGHTHGGQIFPISFMANKIFPYNKGLHEYNGTYIYVSQGVATYMPRMRLGTKNEINVINLRN